MTDSAASLNQYFQSLNQFVCSRTNKYRGLTEVSQELEKIAPLSNSHRLSVQNLSQFPVPSEGLQNFFNAHQGLRQF